MSKFTPAKIYVPIRFMGTLFRIMIHEFLYVFWSIYSLASLDIWNFRKDCEESGKIIKRAIHCQLSKSGQPLLKFRRWEADRPF